MECFVFGKFSCSLAYVSEMKKSEFEKKFERVFDVKEGYKYLQTLKKEQKVTSKR